MACRVGSVTGIVFLYKAIYLLKIRSDLLLETTEYRAKLRMVLNTYEPFLRWV